MAKAWASKFNLQEVPVNIFDLQGFDRERGLKAVHSQLEDYRVFDLADGVTQMPAGLDRRLLTRVIEHVRANNDQTALLSGFHNYVRDHGHQLDQSPLPPMVRGNVNSDALAIDNHRDTIAKYAKEVGWQRK